MPLLTLLPENIQAFERRRRKMLSTPVAAIYAAYVPRSNSNLANSYFILTEIPQFNIPTIPITITKSHYSKPSGTAEANQVSFILLANEMFKGTVPMEGNELKALLKTIKKQRSQTPTSLL